MIHANELKEALNKTTEVTQIKPGQGLAGIFEAMNLMEDHMRDLGLCPTCLSGFAEVTELGSDFALGVMVGREVGRAVEEDREEKEEDRNPEDRTEYRIWTNAERTVLVTRETDGTTTVALRPAAGHAWGPPVVVVPEP